MPRSCPGTACTAAGHATEDQRAAQGRSAAHPLDLMTSLLQPLHQAVAVLALDLDHTILASAARTAGCLQLFGDQRQLSVAARQATHHRHHLAFAALHLAGHPHHAVARWTGRRRTTHALRHGLPALGAHAPGFGGIHQGAVALSESLHGGQYAKAYRRTRGAQRAPPTGASGADRLRAVHPFGRCRSPE